MSHAAEVARSAGSERTIFFAALDQAGKPVRDIRTEDILIRVDREIVAAVVELGAAHRLDPTDPEPLAHLAYCEIKLGQTDAGRAHAAQALALDPAHALAKPLIAK